ncbi:MAG: dihydropteroate synthase [Candidatus Omnitrophica bacterium]|nr:dihydropteroate synthase [Candidatus Omnitrophota bacterium]
MRRSFFELQACGYQIPLGLKTSIMGILNCTHDSFSGDGFLSGPKGQMDKDQVLRYARKMVKDGADILDVGGESTRPGSSGISAKEEIRRVVPVVDLLVRHIKVPVSVDTSKIEVAQAALDKGASIVNNIMGTQTSIKFLKMVCSYDAALVMMHMRGTPATMQSKTRYKNVIQDVIDELKISVEKCLRVGIKKERIIIDPGIGFAKNVGQNLMLIHHLNKLSLLRCPVLLGVSRKSFIGQVLDKGPSGRLMGTAAAVTVGIMQGAHIVRVHDVRTIKETVRMTDAILKNNT